MRTSVKRSLQRRAGESAGDVSKAPTRAKEQITGSGTPNCGQQHTAEPVSTNGEFKNDYLCIAE